MKPEIVICLGKMLIDGAPDWVLEARLYKTIAVAKQFPEAQVLLTGGKSHLLEGQSTISEAQAMKDFVLRSEPTLQNRIMIEDKSDSTIDQMIRIKLNVIIPSSYHKIALITDEIHMARALATAKHIMGAEVVVTGYPSEVKISGTYRKAMQSLEEHSLKLLEETRLNVIAPGDHGGWRRLNDEYKALNKKDKERLLGI